MYSSKCISGFSGPAASHLAAPPAPRYGGNVGRFLGSGFCVGYPGGGSTVSSAESPRSVESPESVTGGGDPDVGMTGGQAFDRAWDGVREPRHILMAHETKFQSRTLETWAYRRRLSLTSFSSANLWKTFSLWALTADYAMKAGRAPLHVPRCMDRRRIKQGGGAIRSRPMTRAAIQGRSCSSPNLRRAESPKSRLFWATPSMGGRQTGSH